uniref:SSD domain-containing protein n=1 Tax=Plectus sambesii TaxID=2011161 RepID=A0A914WSB2_9BILA
MLCWCRTIDKPVTRFFGWYGGGVLVDHYFWFIVTPILMTAALSLGFARLNDLTVLETKILFNPLSAPSWQEERTINELWPLRPYEFLPERTFQWDRYVSLMIFARQTGHDGQSANLLEGHYLDKIAAIEDDIAANVSFILDADFEFANDTPLNMSQRTIKFQHICLNWYGDCYRQSGLIELLRHKDELEERGIAITFPRANTQGTPIYLAFNLGGVQTNINDTIKVVRAIRIYYFLRADTKEMNRLSMQFEDMAVDYARRKFEHDPDLNVLASMSRSIDVGLKKNSDRAKPFFIVTILTEIIIAAFFAVKWSVGPSAGIQIDFLRSKPWLAFGGVLTAGLGIISGIGFMLCCGVLYTEIATGVPFLILAEERAALRKKPVHEKMSETMSEAAVSITITAATDTLSFAVGCITTIIGVQGFCAFAAAAVFFTYIYMMTLFPALMVVSAYHQEAGRNGFLPWIRADQFCLFGNIVKSVTTGPLKHNDSEKSQHPSSEVKKPAVKFSTPPERESFLRRYYVPVIMNQWAS